jgi:hypothetical protein
MLMHPATDVANPFALMMNPEEVIAAMNQSDRLRHLKSHICRPLDKPVALKSWSGAVEQECSADAKPQ